MIQVLSWLGLVDTVHFYCLYYRKFLFLKALERSIRHINTYHTVIKKVGKHKNSLFFFFYW